LRAGFEDLTPIEDFGEAGKMSIGTLQKLLA
jgi:hypothetical protein